MVSNSVIKAPLNLKAQQGDTFTRKFTFTKDSLPLDLTGYELKLSVKDLIGATVLEWLNADFILSTTGVYTITKTATQTGATYPGVYCYDLQITTPTGEQRTWMYGQFIIEQQTT